MTTPAADPGPAGVGSLVGRRPQVPAARLLAELVPPRHFAGESFDTFVPDPAFGSQQGALARLRAVAREIDQGRDGRAGARAGRSWFGARRRAEPPAVYLDGGFGVGKTHLLASLAHAVGPSRAAYGTFVEFTNLVGALGFAPTVEALATKRLVAIDEFELDDPGDTVLMSRLLRELADRGVALAATSNTLPESLGEGRFAAEDFLREIQALAARFEVLRIDGEDYRHRSASSDVVAGADDDVDARVRRTAGATLDDFGELVAHLAQVHPSRYGALLDGVTLVGLTGVGPVDDESAALRLVVLVDRLYDRDVPVLLGAGAGEAEGAGTGVIHLFAPAMLTGGYRKKYYRTLSRLSTLSQASAMP